MKSQQLISNHEPTLLYICSAARCGSTFTDMFLGGHSQVASLGELNFLSKALSVGELCSCGSNLSDCAQWCGVFQRVDQITGGSIKRDPYGFRLWDAIAYNNIDLKHQTRAWRAAVWMRKGLLEARWKAPRSLRFAVPLVSVLEEAIENKLLLTGLVSESWGKRVVVDSSKNPWEAVELFRRAPDQVRILLVTRDGRGVFASRRRTGRSRLESIRGWRNYYRRAVPLLGAEIGDSSFLQIKYEDLARSPENVGKQLCSFLNIDFEEEMLDLSRGSRHLVNGNDTRFQAGKGIRLDERWRSELDVDELGYFHNLAGRMNAQLGYE